MLHIKTNKKSQNYSLLITKMGIFKLLFKARLDGIDSILFPTEISWFCKIACASCREVHDKDVSFSINEQVQTKGSRGNFNFVYTCKLCSKTSTIVYVHTSFSSYGDNERYSPIIELECRGLKILSWSIASGAMAVSSSGNKFSDTNFAENDWCDYDEEMGQLVGVYEIDTKVEEC
ncbi:hypothetical protein SteCoe_21953 [Stentor coeruleus]|uniref:Uncharacterized protein n=1 Tax=Stentor coeruleus TaxID=5963 RepID=A0A1R2BNY3_9CILI|nr:hypothetical protein SteCoe_21953 [Stentor coeruleus]